MESPNILELAKATYLRPTQRQKLRQSIASLEALLNNAPTLEAVHGIAINREAASESLARDKQMLETGTPPDYSVAVKNRLYSTMKAIEQHWQTGLPSQDMMERPTPANIDWHIAHSTHHQHEGLAWKTIRRLLDPDNDNPNFTNLDILRTNTPPKGNPRLYWQGFDAASWEADTQEDLTTQVDDTQYQQFLELKVLGWTQLTICKELAWDKRQYQAAMQRFHARMQAAHPEVELPEDGERLEDEDAATPPGEEEEEEAAVSIAPVLGPMMAPFDEHSKWPLGEMAKRQLTRMDMTRITGEHHTILYPVLNGLKRPQPPLRKKIQDVFENWDRAHAWRTGTTPLSPPQAPEGSR